MVMFYSLKKYFDYLDINKIKLMVSCNLKFTVNSFDNFNLSYKLLEVIDRLKFL